MGGPADQHLRSHDVACGGRRQIVLTQMEYVGTGGASDVGAVVDRQECSVPLRRVGEDFQGRQLSACLQRPEPGFTGRAFVAQLDDVHAAGQRRFGEVGEIAALAAGVGAQVQPGAPEALTGPLHTVDGSD